MKFRDSALAHHYLDGLSGIEIGASAHNPFNLAGRCVNVDFTADMTTAFKQAEVTICGEAAPVHVVADGADLPFDSGTLDYVLSSHVFEHFYDPIHVLNEWLRVLRPGGCIFAIIPHKERTFDHPRHRTRLWELVARHSNPGGAWPSYHGHYSVWVPADFVELCDFLEVDLIDVQDPDDKVGNGFTVVIRKRNETVPRGREASARAVLTSPSANPTYSGSLGMPRPDCIFGWAWNERQPDDAVAVDLLLDGEHYLTTLTADAFRPDLRDLRMGNGRHGFSVPVPESIRDGRTHRIWGAISGTAILLANSPRVLTAT